MTTKKNEDVIVVKTAKELTETNWIDYCYAARRICRTWTEDFMDDDTGEVVSIERNELLYSKGHHLMPDDYSSLLFHMQSGDVKEVWLSNQQRRATLVNNRGFGLWVVKAEGAKIKPKMMLRATNAMSAYEVAKDYIELNYRGDFFIKSIKTYGDSIVIEPSKDSDDKDLSRNWYTVGILLDIEHGLEDKETQGPYNFVVYAETVEAAKAIIENYIAKKRAEREDTEQYSLKMTSATTISADTIIPMEFCMAYRKGGDDEQE